MCRMNKFEINSLMCMCVVHDHGILDSLISSTRLHNACLSSYVKKNIDRLCNKEYLLRNRAGRKIRNRQRVANNYERSI